MSNFQRQPKDKPFADKARNRKLDTDREPWDRQSWEHTKSFQHFMAYRDLGIDRSYAEYKRLFDKDPRPLAIRNKWGERLMAWDTAKGRLRSNAILKAAELTEEQLADRRKSILLATQSLVALELARYMHKAGADAANPDPTAAPTFAPDELRKWATWAFEAERKEYGMPDVKLVYEDKTVPPEVIQEISILPEKTKDIFAKFLGSMDDEKTP